MTLGARRWAVCYVMSGTSECQRSFSELFAPLWRYLPREHHISFFRLSFVLWRYILVKLYLQTLVLSPVIYLSNSGVSKIRPAKNSFLLRHIISTCFHYSTCFHILRAAIRKRKIRLQDRLLVNVPKTRYVGVKWDPFHLRFRLCHEYTNQKLRYFVTIINNVICISFYYGYIVQSA